LTACLAALEAGDINHLATVAENEALTLHSLIMTSGGGTVLMEPTTINIIKRIQWARRNGLGVFFTLDAGPNVHLLYPESGCGEVEAFIRNELIAVAEQQQIIFDRCGDGPVEILNGNH
jgi:diphosphomevalonate decarboxylase